MNPEKPVYTIGDDVMNTYALHTDGLRAAASRLRAGDKVLLSGTVYTSRDAAHKRLFALMDEGKPLPFPLKDAVIYYSGATPAPEGLPIGACGPTTSGRMDIYTPRLDVYKRQEQSILSGVGILIFIHQHLIEPLRQLPRQKMCIRDRARIDRDKLNYALKLSGLYEKVQDLPNKENTMLMKSLVEDSIELSGGEQQKLALARALYKDCLLYTSRCV